MRYCSLILIAHWPSRSPPRAWSLFPGGIFNSSTLSTWSSCASLSWALRTACPDTALDLRPIKSFWVSLSLKLLITGGFWHASYDISSDRLVCRLGRHELLEGASSCHGVCACDFLSYGRILTLHEGFLMVHLYTKLVAADAPHSILCEAQVGGLVTLQAVERLAQHLPGHLDALSEGGRSVCVGVAEGKGELAVLAANDAQA
jgi:hypothetical protein